MVSSRGSYDEEGEIPERVSEKAPPSLPSVVGHVVDRSSRHRDSRSPSYDTYSRNYREMDDGRARKRHRGDDRSRERDYRDYDRDRDRRYGRRDDGPSRRHQVSYADIDDSRPASPMTPRDSDRGYSRYDRKRTRSITRSPPPPRRRQYDDYRPRRYDERDRDRGDRSARRDSREEYDYRKRERDVTDRSNRSDQNDSSRKLAEGREKATSEKKEDHRNGMPDGSANNESKGKHESKEEQENEPDPEPMEVDEEKLIEERRKRRQAILAKYKGSTAPLLATTASGPASPAAPDSPAQFSEAASPDSARLPLNAVNKQVEQARSPNTPRTPAEAYREESPSTFEIIKEPVGAANNGRQEDNLESSAADYDPVRDMEEDQKRREQQLQQEDLSAAQYDEMRSPREVPVPVAKKSEPKADDDDFDMFAEGDDDDMFAEAPPKFNKETTSTKGIPLIAQGRQINNDLHDSWDDPEGYYRVILSEVLDDRYVVQATLGKGSFASVIRAFDKVTEKLVAIKIIRNNETLRKAALKEMAILQKLEQADPEDKKHIVRLERHFEHKGHLCMVFENLSINLREVLKKFGRDVGINLKAVRAYAQQLFLGLAHLRKCNILHADLKPDNILVNEARNMLKICDLGSASDASENEITPYLASRFYRAPEIILGVPYDFAIDMWSAGCTLYELYTGKILFTGRTNNQMLRAMMECRGKFSHKLLKKGQFSAMHFDENLNFRSVEQDRVTGKEIVRSLTINKPTRELKTRVMSAAAGAGADDATEIKDLQLFIDLLDRCLNLNPEKRCTPTEALRHPFIMRTRF